MATKRDGGTKRKQQEPSQLVDLFLSVAAALGIESDRDIASVAGMSIENVSNWKSGAVREFKPQKLSAIKRGLAARIHALQERARTIATDPELGLMDVEVEQEASPAEIQRQLRDRVHYDYLGHRFLYFDPQGALAWESLIHAGYQQDQWVRGVADCAAAWLDTARDSHGGCRGPLATALGYDRRAGLRGLDVISLGPGEGGKEVVLLEQLLQRQRKAEQALPWANLALVDVSISLLLRAAHAARAKAREVRSDAVTVMPFCSDFEEGQLAFERRLPTSREGGEQGLRLVVILGNVFGNLRDEEVFLHQKLQQLVRPGDMLWLEVGMRPERLELDPLFRLTQPDREETAAEANRRLLLEGPYRRWESALGRKPTRLDMRVWVREDDDASRIPGSCNFCHDLIIGDERRAVTMLYSRRYAVEGLSGWLEEHGYKVERIMQVGDPKRWPRVAHLLLRRTR